MIQFNLQALDAILEGLSDPYVKLGHRLALHQRAQKILKAKKNSKLLHREQEFEFDEYREIPKVKLLHKVYQMAVFINQWDRALINAK